MVVFNEYIFISKKSFKSRKQTNRFENITSVEFSEYFYCLLVLLFNNITRKFKLYKI